MGPDVVVVGHPVAELPVEVLPVPELVEPEELLLEDPPPPFHLAVGLGAKDTGVFVDNTEARHFLLKGVIRTGGVDMGRELLAVVREDGPEPYAARPEPGAGRPKERGQRLGFLVGKEPGMREAGRVVHERREVLLFLGILPPDVAGLVDVDMPELPGAFLLVTDDPGLAVRFRLELGGKGFELGVGPGERTVVRPYALMDAEIAEPGILDDLSHRVAMDAELTGQILVLVPGTMQPPHLLPLEGRDFRTGVHTMETGKMVGLPLSILPVFNAHNLRGNYTL